MAKKQTQNTEAAIDLILKDYAKNDYLFGSRSGDEILAQETVTTGSFWFDYVLNGGFRTGSWSRFYSEPECGKTSMALCWGKNWQDKYKENAFVIYFNAEGRINKDLIDRSGIDYSKERFRIVDTNSYEVIFNTTERLIKNNPNDIRYFVILDSTDACVKEENKDKSFGEAEKMAGGAAILSAAGKRISLLFNRGNHHLYLCSQVRDKMSAQAKGGKDTSGGNAPRFYSSLTGEIKKPWTDTILFENPSDTKSNHIGRFCEIKLHKTPNETTGKIVRIPIRYGLKGGIWRAYESMMVAQAWSMYKKEGAWFSVDEHWAEEFKKNNLKFEGKVQGEKNLRTMFDSNPDLTNFCLQKGALLIANDGLASKVADGDTDTGLADDSL